MPTITPKQKQFCLEYVVDHNGTRAAIRAGYSENSAASIACELLTKPHILDEIKRLEDLFAAKIESKAIEAGLPDAEWVLKKSQELHELSNETLVPSLDQYGEHESNPITGELLYKQVSPNLSVAAKSLELVGKNKLVRAFDNVTEHHLHGELAEFFNFIRPTIGPPTERDITPKAQMSEALPVLVGGGDEDE